MRHVHSASLLTALLSATKVAAHGHVTNIVVNGVYYEGFDINSFPYMGDNAPTVAAWTTPNTGNGPLAPDDYSSPDIICHQNATAGKGYVEVNAGDRISLQWTPWPESHHGPVIDYLARCEPNCASVDKTSLEFFKIDGVGIVDGSSVPGVWGDDQLIKNNNSWLVEIPKSIAPGHYVLRHELIALHSAGTEGGAQNYPSCFNLKVNGDGTDKPAGVVGTELYTPTSDGIIFNIYQAVSEYPVPGPTLYTGAATGVTQATSAVTSTGTAQVIDAVATTPVSVPSASSSAVASSSATPSRSPSPSSSAVASSSAAASR
ncbi:putative endo-1,4-beta-glucanase [Aspergillus alliaceus]|uniref:putative endo-1,4-beta-glucanase n=1 Tax=Petromyces alliaceus TaxID=209559 RepID=UPI0012A539E2|nr:glycosyl hydrolase family 61-domain-containing protein [Aspergillus alliaceus]KAB8227624.1 glycosyl hydrolase family 61-domain-containing protein [Aspergillus alliaceus]